MVKGRQDPSMSGGRLDTAVMERIRLAVASNYIVTMARIQDDIHRRAEETGYPATASEDMLGLTFDAPSITLIRAIPPEIWAREMMSQAVNDLFVYFGTFNINTIKRSIETYPSSRFKMHRLLSAFQRGNVLNCLLHKISELSGFPMSMATGRSILGCHRYIAKAGLDYISEHVELPLRLDIWDREDLEVVKHMVTRSSPIHKMKLYQRLIHELEEEQGGRDLDLTTSPIVIFIPYYVNALVDNQVTEDMFQNPYQIYQISNQISNQWDHTRFINIYFRTQQQLELKKPLIN